MICVLSLEFGDLYMWGWNEKGQLGLCVNHYCDARQTASGQVQCQTVPVPINFPDDSEVMTVSCGTRHTAAVTGMQTVIIPRLQYQRLLNNQLLIVEKPLITMKKIILIQWNLLNLVINRAKGCINRGGRI